MSKLIQKVLQNAHNLNSMKSVSFFDESIF